MTILEKRDEFDSVNNRGVSVLFAARAVISRIFLSHLLSLAKELVHKSQCEFCLSRGIEDTIFITRNQGSRTNHYTLSFTLHHLKGAVEHPAQIWSPQKCVSILRLAYIGMHTQFKPMGAQQIQFQCWIVALIFFSNLPQHNVVPQFP